MLVPLIDVIFLLLTFFMLSSSIDPYSSLMLGEYGQQSKAPAEPTRPFARPDLILRQAPSPQSVFRGLVRPNGMAASDVLQVWVDVSSHPSRGREQAELIRKRILNRIIEGNS